jgi:SAM-dependent methyltransferase
MQTKAAGILEERRHIWQSKEILRHLYHKWYHLIREALKPGIVLELGGGSGNLKEFFPDTISTDILFAPWLDAVLDGHRLPLKRESVNSIVLFDVLHHLAAPACFFFEAERVLSPGGRILMMEPYVSWSSFFIYRFLHQEGLHWSANPLDPEGPDGTRDPFQGNQAIPTLLFERYRKAFQEQYQRLRILREERMDFFTYPLSGGFHHRNLCTLPLGRFLDRCETFLRPLSSCLAFRIFLVVEKV